MKAGLEKQTEYLIGDVARIVGLSRDALRFYEKKGVISARKKENGYRYYSEDDIYKLMYILYHRKTNSSLEDIEGLMTEEKTTDFMRRHIGQRIQAEMEAMEHHRQAIARLRLMEKDIQRIEQCMNQCSLRKFPLAYIMGDCADLQEGLRKWFDLSSSLPGLDMTYFYNILSYGENGGNGENRMGNGKTENKKLDNKGTRLLFYKELEAVLGDKFDPGLYPMTEETDCIYMVTASENTLPDRAMVEQMICWGQSHGIETEGTVYANDMTSFFDRGKATYFLELYMPIKRVLMQMQQ